jgi:hypothetical protein
MEFFNPFKRKEVSKPDLSEAAAQQEQLNADNTAFEQGDYDSRVPDKTLTDTMKGLQEDLQKGPPENRA